MDLRDKLKFWMALSNYVDMIVRGTSPLSLPDAIANSLSYVKAFGGTEQRNLPDGYTQLEYIQSSGSQYIDTGRVPNNNDIIEQKFQKVGSSDTTCSWYGSMPSSQIITPRIGIGTYSSQGVSSMFAGSNYTGNIGVADTNVHTLRFQATGQTELTYTLDGVTDVIDASTSAVPPDMYEPAVELTSYLFARHGTNGVQVYDNEGTKIYYHREYLANGTLALNMVPVKRNSDNVLGMYDLVSGQFFTNQGTGDFVAGSTATPTPDTPMDIVSNNGVLKARHESGLPTGYTLLDYIESTGTQYIDLGYKGNGTTKAEVRFKYHTASSASGSGRVFGSRNAATVDAFAIGSASGTASTNSTVAFFFGNQSYLVTDKSLVLDEWLGVIFDKTTHNINGTDYGDPYNDETFETLQNLKLFGFDNNGTMGYGQVDIAYCKLWDNGVLVRDLVPAKNSSNVVGMYDLVSGQFFTNQGTGDFTAGDPVSDPVEIYTDGTVETINVHGKNLFDANSNKAFVEENTQYTVSLIKTAARVNIAAYDTNDTLLEVVATWSSAQTGAQQTTFTTPENTKYIACASTLDLVSNVQIEQGSTATDYVPYFDGGTATAEMLLKVGDYQDVQSIIDGTVTRNVGVKVFDGTENWVDQFSNYGRVFLVISDLLVVDPRKDDCLVTHFGYIKLSTTEPDKYFHLMNRIYLIPPKSIDNITDFKAWLASQYAAGTPVIVVYPLATPTTESVTGQTLQVTAGDNVLEITQASLNNLELEAEYQKEA